MGSSFSVNSSVVGAKMGVAPYSQEGPSWKTAWGRGAPAYQAEFYFLFPLLSTPSWPIILFSSPRVEISLVQMLQPGPGSAGGTKGRALFTFGSEFSVGSMVMQVEPPQMTHLATWTELERREPHLSAPGRRETPVCTEIRLSNTNSWPSCL